MSISCVIIDDEYLAINILKEYAGRLKDLEVLHTFTRSDNALDFLRQHTTDLLLLDIHMPLMSGMDLLARLEDPPLVIFTTAHQDYAVRAFELNVLDYLVKPVSFERFAKAIQRVRDYNQRKEPSVESEFITIKADHRMIRLRLDEIAHIEGLNEYVRIHTDNRVYVTLAALKRLEEQLPPQRFVRIHKSFIVSRSRVSSFNRDQVILQTGLHLPIGRAYRDNLSTL